MKPTNMIGYGLLATPFVAGTIAGAMTIGPMAMAEVWGVTAIIVGLICAGVYLAND